MSKELINLMQQTLDRQFDVDDKIKQQKINDRFGSDDLDCDWSFDVQDDAPERKDWLIPELI
jgi:hypothetical protein